MTYTVHPITEKGETRYVVRDPQGNPVNGVKHETWEKAEQMRLTVEACMRGMANQRGRG